MTDTLETIVLPALIQAGNPPPWVEFRGQDVRAYDRRDERLVLGPSHHFRQPSDLLLTNGLIRLWPGPRLSVPYLNVEAFTGGAWRPLGVISLEGDADADRLVDARLHQLTVETGVLILDVRNAGQVSVQLRRGERTLRITHGTSKTPAVSSGRYVRWRGIPPHLYLGTPTLTDTAKFGRALDASVAVAKFEWPRTIRDAWTFAFWWIPGAASATQADSGLLYIVDGDGEQVGRVEYLTATDTVLWTLGSQTVETPAITFAADEPVFVAVSFSTLLGMLLVVKPDDGALVSDVDAAATDPSTSAAEYAAYYTGLVSTGFDAGDGDAGDENAGGVTLAAGGWDNGLLFGAAYTLTQLTTLSAAASALDGLPVEGDLLVWLPFDADIEPAGSDLSDGRRYQATSEGGTTRSPDEFGLTRMVAGLTSGLVAVTGLAVGQYAETLEAAVTVATTDTADDLTDLHEQLSAAGSQEARTR